MAGAVEEHVEGVLEWGVVAAAELVVVGGVLASACGEVRISDQAGPTLRWARGGPVRMIVNID